jgi:hypothetical protein
MFRKHHPADRVWVGPSPGLSVNQLDSLADSFPLCMRNLLLLLRRRHRLGHHARVRAKRIKGSSRIQFKEQSRTDRNLGIFHSAHRSSRNGTKNKELPTIIYLLFIFFLSQSSFSLMLLVSEDVEQSSQMSNNGQESCCRRLYTLSSAFTFLQKDIRL